MQVHFSIQNPTGMVELRPLRLYIRANEVGVVFSMYVLVIHDGTHATLSNALEYCVMYLSTRDKGN